ncbi:glycoside hydrolase family 3 C-terminal domain-containing protein [Alkalibacter rhizosphaerae]|uniref:Glycoside hydrolase family 3 C-terminal domain-containing protein n=1 Tax=Alkalibacter rhizosphaerae TaxID=2815577 RepID=A0A975AIJ3_9FIRM|nr:glycoside hydrolase family 3 C-terminal domain-containing protein [Alkalibacter rhizosphaerae]QSX09143.1 glycoside hydrolase family 3 C-terminal domain-containing protein [Alkalibacter rhizosphaerae]
MEKAKEIVNRMTLKEKASLCSGQDFWRLQGVEKAGLPSIMATDGPHGLRKTIKGTDHIGVTASLPSTCFPTSVTTACSWDPHLLEEIGKAIGSECKSEGVSILLGPGMNIKRSPLCGRNFEYISEDPYLTGKMAAGMIRGIQSMGIGATMKHFVANNKEGFRLVSDSIVDQRALQEIYLTGFEMALNEGQPWVVMAAYNKVNGTYCCENRYLMTEVLREKWGFSGIIVSDWGATDHRIRALNAGLDVEMPSTYGEQDRRIYRGVKKGRVLENTLNETAERIVDILIKAKNNADENATYDKETHHRLARKAARESYVLLKNDEDLLPLDTGRSTAIIGDMAKNPRYQGLGSSMLHPTFLENTLDEMEKQGWNVSFAPGYTWNSDEVEEEKIKEASTLAAGCEAAVVFVGLPEKYEAENLDRKHMKMPASHQRLIQEVAKANPNTVVVLAGGAPVEMPWINEVKAVVNGYLGGQAGASAMLEILCGKANPCGKLAETYPVALKDNPTYNYFVCIDPKIVQYRESVYVGYRFYDTASKEVLFPFGHGLSYTKFSYENLRLSCDKMKDNERLVVRMTVRNIGDRPGKEVVQVYVRDTDTTVFRPEKELKGFEKVHLDPGEAKELEFVLDFRAFAYYNTALDNWHVESGFFEILIGASSRDMRLQGRVYVESSEPDAPVPYDLETASEYHHLKNEPFRVSDAAFQAIYGSPVSATKKEKVEEFTLNSTMDDMQHTLIGKAILWKVKRESLKMPEGELNEGMQNALDAMVKESPIRTLNMASKGDVSLLTIRGLVQLANKEYLEGLRTLLIAARRKRD